MFGSESYAALGAFGIEGMLQRFTLYGISFTMLLSFLSFVPTQKMFFTNIGRYTLYVYLLHGFIVRPFRASEIKNEFNSEESIIWLVAIALIITILLSTKAVTSFFQPIIELRMNRFKLFVQKMRERMIYYFGSDHQKQKLRNHHGDFS